MTRPSLSDYGTHDESAFPHLWEGVVGAWCPSLGPTGLRLHDFSRRANWGTLTNMDAATDWVVDGGQYALDLDGSNDFFATGSTVVLAENFSIFGWFNLRSFATSPQAWSDSVNNFSLMFFPNSSTLRIRDSQLSNAVFSTTLPANQWFFVAISTQSKVMRCFINGVEAGSSPFTFATNAIFNFNYFGRNPVNFSNQLDGLFDDQVFLNRPSHVNEIRELYQIGRGGMYTPRRRRRAYSYRPTGLRRRLILTGQT